MASLNTTNGFNLTISATEDSTSSVDIIRNVVASIDSNYSLFNTYQKLTSGSPINIVGLAGVGTAYQVYVRNLDPTVQIQVTMTPTGGTAAIVTVLNPGDFFAIVQKTAGAAAAGYTSVAIAALTATALVEYFIGG